MYMDLDVFLYTNEHLMRAWDASTEIVKTSAKHLIVEYS
jgi:hypothetical protein